MSLYKEKAVSAEEKSGREKMITGKTKIYSVIGFPVEHSASPALHNAALEALGLDARYVALTVKPEDVADAVRGFRAMGMGGLNVTVPHKRAVIPFLDSLGEEAAKMGSVNTVVRAEDGRLVGHNTDAAGFLGALAHHGADVAGKRALVYGAGGAAPAVLRALQLGGAAGAHVFNRTREKADALADLFNCESFQVKAEDFSSPEIDTLYGNADIIINATSIGLREGDTPPVEVGKITSRHTVADIIYNPWETALLREARQKGAAVFNGYEMLVRQAAEAFTLWTGKEAPVGVMREAGLDFLRKTGKL